MGQKQLERIQQAALLRRGPRVCPLCRPKQANISFFFDVKKQDIWKIKCLAYYTYYITYYNIFVWISICIQVT